METSIFAQIRKESQDFFFSFIAPVPGYSFNQYTTIKRNHLYYNSKYENGSMYLGRDKLFFNVVNPACEVATKMLNVDTKNIRLWPLNDTDGNAFGVYLLEKELKEWLKTSDMSRVLNQIAVEAPIYGSVCLEKTKDGAKVVDLRRFILDPSVDTVTDSRFVITVHYMTETELRDTGWDNVEEVIQKFGSTQAQSPFEDYRGNVNQQVSTPYVKVYRRFGEVPQGWLDGSASDKLVRSVMMVAGADVVRKSPTTGQIVAEDGLILFKSTLTKAWPFKDFHYMKTKGRWLGIGVIEMLYDVQVRMNELKNQKRISMEISSIHLFQTKDKGFVRNVLTDLESGDLLVSPNGIEPVANEERNLSAFKDEEDSYGAQVDKLSFAYQAIRGEAPPSTTPLGVVQISNAQASSVFAFKRENLCIFLREFFNELVQPQLLKDLDAKHIMRFTGSSHELEKLDQAAAELHANNVIKHKMLYGMDIAPDEGDRAKAHALRTYKKLGSHRFLTIKEAFYGEAEYDFDYIVDNEQVDPQTMASNLQKIIGDLASNPNILSDPRIKLLYFKFAESIGVNPTELEMVDEQAQNQLLNNQNQNGQNGSTKPQLPQQQQDGANPGGQSGQALPAGGFPSRQTISNPR